VTGDCLCLNLGIECWCTRPGPGGSGYAPHGTAAAARRHYRREGPGWTCDPCRRAESRRWLDQPRRSRARVPLRPATPAPAMPEGARRVLEMRHWAGMTQKALAAGLGLERSAVSRWESGRCEPGVVVLGRVAAVTGFPAGGAAGWEAAA